MEKAEFDRFADEYEVLHRANVAITGEEPDFFAAYKLSEFARLASTLGLEPSRILDFGSGIGNSIPHFRKHFPRADLTCADASARSIALSESRFPGPERYRLVTETIPIENDTFDAVFSACVFHHIQHEEHSHWLSELHRVTRDGGMLAIFEHNPLNPLTLHAVNTCPFDENAHLLRAGELKRAMKRAGWEDPAVRYHLFFPRALAALRPLESRLAWAPIGAQYSVHARKGRSSK